jgi:hypothetical protein
MNSSVEEQCVCIQRLLARTRAALFWQPRHDGIQLRTEAHVQQPIRLIKYEHLSTWLIA